MAKKLLWLSVLAAIVGFIRSFPSGPPPLQSVCINVVPASFSPHKQQPTNGNYFINTNLIFRGQFYEYTAGNTYTVEVKGIQNATFRGFIVQAWAPDNSKIGTFVPQNLQQTLVNCDRFSIPQERTIAHNNNDKDNFVSQILSWTAPMSSNGLVDFRFTVVPSVSKYFGGISAAAEQARVSTARIPILPIGADRAEVTKINKALTKSERFSSEVPETVTDPDRDPEDYRITARFPNDCAVSECSVFVGIDTNTGDNTYLDIYLEGAAKAWVAVGFTKSPNMIKVVNTSMQSASKPWMKPSIPKFSADVLACNVNPDTNMVEALDTWNDEVLRFNYNVDIQNAYLHSGTFTNGRIQCTMVRKIAGSGRSTKEFNLDGAYYLLYGVGMVQDANSLLNHEFGIDGNPQVSKSQVNPSLGQMSFGRVNNLIYFEVLTTIEKTETRTIIEKAETRTIIEKAETRTIIEKAEDKAELRIKPFKEFGKAEVAGEVRTTCASWLMVSVLFLYSLALRV